MSASFVVYVDESGDDGFSFGQGSPELFVLSAVVTRKTKDLDLSCFPRKAGRSNYQTD